MFLELKQNVCSTCVYRLEAAQAQAEEEEEEEEEEAGGRRQEGGFTLQRSFTVGLQQGALHLNTQGKIVTL